MSLGSSLLENFLKKLSFAFSASFSEVNLVVSSIAKSIFASRGLAPPFISSSTFFISSKGLKLKRSNHFIIISSGMDIVLPKISSAFSVMPI